MIAEMLGRGEESAQSSTILCDVLHLTRRDLTKCIMVERRAGAPICSTTSGSSRGYFLAANKDEMSRFCGRLRHRAGEIFKTRAACLKTIEDLPEGAEL